MSRSITVKFLLSTFSFSDLVERKAKEVVRTKNDVTVTVSTEEYAKIHVNRENFSFADKSMRYGL